MMQFEQRSISNSQTLGDRLYRLRLERKKDLKSIAHHLRIRTDYLEALEQSRYTDLPGEVFVRNYVRKYAAYLGLNVTQAEELLNEELAVYKVNPEIPTLKRHLTQQPLKIIHVVIALVVVFMIIGVTSYFGFEIKNISQPPDLTINDLPNHVAFDQRVVTLSGKTTTEANVTINDQTVPVKSDGTFSQQMTLQSGVNIFKIIVKTKRSKERVEYKQIIVDNQAN